MDENSILGQLKKQAHDFVEKEREKELEREREQQRIRDQRKADHAHQLALVDNLAGKTIQSVLRIGEIEQVEIFFTDGTYIRLAGDYDDYGDRSMEVFGKPETLEPEEPSVKRPWRFGPNGEIIYDYAMEHDGIPGLLTDYGSLAGSEQVSEMIAPKPFVEDEGN